MARKTKKVAKIASFMAVQYLDPQYWKWNDNPYIVVEDANYSDEIKEKGKNWQTKVEKGDIEFIEDVIKSRFKQKFYHTSIDDLFEALYIILHDRDSRKVWDESIGEYVLDMKPPHVHIVGRFKKGQEQEISGIADIIGIESQYIEKPKPGRYGYDNMLSYLIHIKDTDKFQYQPSDVHTGFGMPYQEVYNEQRELWLKGRAKVTKKRAEVGSDELEEAILQGEVTKSQVMLTDELFEVYSRDSVRLDRAFAIYGERKAYKAIAAMEQGKFKLTVIFVEGESRSGKSTFTDRLVDEIIKRRKEANGEQWNYMSTAASNPFDEYTGEEVIKMDDLRGVAMTASDWLKLLDPERPGTASARYKNKRVASRVIVINSEKSPAEFFQNMKNSQSQLSEAMDQFYARIMKLVRVIKTPSEKRLVKIHSSRRLGIEGVKIANLQNKHSEKIGGERTLVHSNDTNFAFIDDYGNEKYLTFEAAIAKLTDVVKEQNDLVKFDLFGSDESMSTNYTRTFFTETVRQDEDSGKKYIEVDLASEEQKEEILRREEELHIKHQKEAEERLKNGTLADDELPF